MEHLLEAGTCSILSLSKSWNVVISFYRFLSNERVTVEEIVKKQNQELASIVKGKRIIVPIDTTEIDCSSYNNRVINECGLGKLSRGNRGFLLHPFYCLEASTNCPLGVAQSKVWARKDEHSTEKRKGENILNKESNKWYSKPLEAKDDCLKNAKHITYVYDREGDIFEVLSNINDNRTDLVVRCRHNRPIRKVNRKGNKNIGDALKQEQVKAIVSFSSKKKRGRRIKAEIKYTEVEILEPKYYKKLEGTPSSKKINVVQIESKGKEKIKWILLTTKEIRSNEQAIEIIDIYKARWEIEEMFRLMKKESFDIESSELRDGNSIQKLALYVMEAAVKIQQLKFAREGTSDLKTTQLFSKSQIECLHKLNVEYQGNTVKQSNPHDKENLAWASWIIARIGGWKGFKSQRPPGPITLQRGLTRFEHIYLGFKILKK